METLQQEFLKDTETQLEILAGQLNSFSGAFPDEAFLSEAFRRVHSIKGGSQVFGYRVVADLAHVIESLLHDLRNSEASSDGNAVPLLSEGLGHLKLLFIALKTNKEVRFPQDYVSRLQDLLPAKVSGQDRFQINVPDSFLNGLTNDEKAALGASLNFHNQLFVIEVFLLPSEIPRFKIFRELLSRLGKVIAVTAVEIAPPGRLGFRIYFTSENTAAALKGTLTGFDVQIIYPEPEALPGFSHDIQGALDQIVTSGDRAAKQRGKKIRFEINLVQTEIDRGTLKSIYEILIHLVRNAVDHAIESPSDRIANHKHPEGLIKIDILNGEFINLIFEDDGRGIDLDRIGKKTSPASIESGLDLIFTHGFTTREVVSDYSGRGIGLDIVKQIITREGGAVSVSTEPGKGTSFNIKLPNSKKT